MWSVGGDLWNLLALSCNEFNYCICELPTTVWALFTITPSHITHPHTLPGPPQDVIVTPTTSREINMTWQAPTAGAREGYILDYSIVCNSPQDGNFFVSVTLSNETTFYSVSQDVNPYTVYRCCVVAQRSNGDSPLACGTITTLEDGEMSSHFAGD